MNVFKNQILPVGLILAAFAIGATTLVVLTEANTRDKISENERAALLSAINALIPNDKYNNEILDDTLTLAATKQLNTEGDTTVYRARLNSEPVAVILSAIAPNGYNGRIKLLIGINNDGSLAGVRVIGHKETPGLGDKIDVKRHDWILQFQDLSLNNPVESRWKVKKDGGHFDQFTGATITPRAVVTAVKRALQHFEHQQDKLFANTEVER